MTRLEEIATQVSKQNLPPIESWHPEHCAEVDICIRYDGEWFHEGTPIHRKSLVKLFASILKRGNGDYFLVTPIEKALIRVENTPFIIVASERIDDRWFITNNLGEVREFDESCRLDVSNDQNPTLIWRSKLEARVNQNVMYQWQTYALDHDGFDGNSLKLDSGTSRIIVAVHE